MNPDDLADMLLEFLRPCGSGNPEGVAKRRDGMVSTSCTGARGEASRPACDCGSGAESGACCAKAPRQARAVSGGEEREKAAEATREDRAKPGLARPLRSPTAGTGRLFLSEYDIKRRLTGSPACLKLPRGAILSPLAADWLAMKGVRVEWEA